MVNLTLKIESKILAMFKKTARFVSISGPNIEISILGAGSQRDTRTRKDQIRSDLTKQTRRPDMTNFCKQ